MSCLLDGPLGAPAPSAEVAPLDCAEASLDLAGQLGTTWPDAGVALAFTLPRLRAGGVLSAQGATARLLLDGSRSGGEDSYVGVDGESIVEVVRVAEGRFAHAPWGLGVGGGVIESSFVASEDLAWSLTSIAPSFGVSRGWMDASDLGGWAAWSAAEHRVGVRLELTSGEGGNYRERNDGKDLAGTLIVAPIPELSLTLHGRDGSRGLGLARDHRAGAILAVDTRYLAAEAEFLKAWGVGGDAEREPTGGSASVRIRPLAPLLLFGRVDLWTELPGESHANGISSWAGAGVRLPWKGESRPFLLAAGWTGTQLEAKARTVAGADGLAESGGAFVQFDVLLATP